MVLEKVPTLICANVRSPEAKARCMRSQESFLKQLQVCNPAKDFYLYRKLMGYKILILVRIHCSPTVKSWHNSSYPVLTYLSHTCHKLALANYKLKRNRRLRWHIMICPFQRIKHAFIKEKYSSIVISF